MRGEDIRVMVWRDRSCGVSRSGIDGAGGVKDGGIVGDCF